MLEPLAAIFKDFLMENLSIILAVIGLSVLIFSIWNHILIRRHLNQFRNNYRHNSSLTDEKYFELKSKQDYIIAASTIIFALISFVGISSIKDIKSEINSQMESEKKKIEALNTSADSTNKSFDGLKLKGKDLQDSVRSALSLVDALKVRVGGILEKDVIKQNIFIVDPLRIGDFPHSKEKDLENYRIIKFKELETISGQKLPIFKVPPSIICFSTTSSSLIVKDVTTEGFKITPDGYSYLVTEASGAVIAGDEVKFSLWISQKKPKGSFDESFSNDFNK